jgi:acyl carrier protein
MIMTDKEDRLLDIVAQILLLDRSEVKDTLRRKDYEPWDSMAHLILISEIENEFGIFFDDEEIIEIWTVGDLKTALEEKTS